MTQIKNNILNDVCELIVDCEHKTAPTQATGYPSIRTPNIGKGRLLLDNVNRVSEQTYKAWTKRAIPQADDLILAREAPIGNVAIIPNNVKVCLGQRTVLIRANKDKIEPNYLVYLLLGDEIQGKILSISNGATVHHLNMKDIRNLELPKLPSLYTQRKIAAILSAYDRLIENNTRRIEILEEMARSIYREWFVNFRFPGHEQAQMVDSELGPIPEGWEVGRLDDALILQRGFDLPTQQRKEGNIPIYASTGVTGTHNEAKVKAPGVVTGRSGSLGTVIYIDEDFWPLNTTLWVKEFRRVTPLYAFYLLSNLKLEQYNSGAAVPTLNRNDIHGRSVVIPPQKILEHLNLFVEPLLVLKKNLLKRSDYLRQTRDLLLPRLISGEIDVENLDIKTGEIAA
ncbi:restriction endonuclease subunit S [Tychonema sp. LEGE 07203]|uniref:restriction endonuclease subunit S n=1 Tax=Tychonema sp. LEGE 07203 TaxID=1828671 RepID=UPI001881AC47|nr:restriction endonuclease subunit S [Tychonema sp. LEGE 07203]MBE9095483.1 restriction endonuclease subunit S [Tychonema sp. LEGE 07203]